jgi:hypothetical protein
MGRSPFWYNTALWLKNYSAVFPMQMWYYGCPTVSLCPGNVDLTSALLCIQKQNGDAQKLPIFSDSPVDNDEMLTHRQIDSTRVVVR